MLTQTQEIKSTQDNSQPNLVDNFIWIDPQEVDFSNGKFFKKTASITASLIQAGETVITIAGGITETQNTAKPGDYLVKNPGGEQYLVSGETFQKKYKLKLGTVNTYLPVAPPARVVFTQKPVAFTSPWGETMYVQAGGALVEHPQGCYGIQPDEFASTYQHVDV